MSNNPSRHKIWDINKKVDAIINQVDDVNAINSKFQNAWNKKQEDNKYESTDQGFSHLWVRERNSFFTLPQKWVFIHPSKITDDNLQALVELNRFFESQGLIFIVQIVPNLYDIAALVLHPEFQKYGDQQSAVVAKQLLEHGIETQYISDEIVKHAFEYERLFVYPYDFHPEGASDIMTTVMAKRLELFRDILPKQFSPELFSKVLADTKKTWPQNTKLDIGAHKHGSVVQTSNIYYDGKLLGSASNSKIMVFGNSFLISPQSIGYGYVSYLASKILYNSSIKGMGGVSALTGIPYLFLTDTQLLKGKQIVILPISIDFLSGKGYVFTNVKQLDSKFKEMENVSFISSSSPIDYCSSVFPASTKFTYQTIRNYFLSRTGYVALSKEQKEVTIPFPKGFAPQKARISVQPYAIPANNFTTSIIINDFFSRPLTSNFENPNWEIITYDIPEGTKQLAIKFDEVKSTKNALVIIHNISFYE